MLSISRSASTGPTPLAGVYPVDTTYVTLPIHEVHRDIPAPPSLRYGGDFRGACRARSMSVCGAPPLMGGLMVRWGCIRVRSVVSNSAG